MLLRARQALAHYRQGREVDSLKVIREDPSVFEVRGVSVCKLFMIFVARLEGIR